jgi:tight adherence protein C
MNAILHFGENGAATLSLLVFLTVGTLAFAVMVGLRSRSAVRRRAARVAPDGEAFGGAYALRQSGFDAVRKFVERATKQYASIDSKDMKVLRLRLLQAGIYNPHAIAYFFILRTCLAVGIALATLFVVSVMAPHGKASFWLVVMVGGVGGYLAPSFYLDRRVAARKTLHQAGFPDFMDLLVVCADSGLAMEAALERVACELGASHRSLAANIHIANLEIRAGRRLTEALNRLADRLGLEEARSFANLVTQSDELGSSISGALRVYSDDMRHKRLSRAEEKAYSLPAKLAVPMMVCIFPVLFIVILTPVIVRLATGHW